MAQRELRPPVGRRGFTLVEMLVALAVTVVALAVVTVVFNVTTKTATQAAAVSEVESLIRNFMLQLEEDLKQCDPTDSVLVLVGRTQAAARTQDELDAGRYYRVLTGDPNNVPANFRAEFDNVDPLDPLVYQYSNPRADILMFFSSRPSASQAPPTNPLPNDTFGQSLLAGAKFSPIQVVYGHAAFDDAVLSGGPGSPYVFADNLRHIEDTIDGSNTPAVQSRIPANRWHLARRATILNVLPLGSMVPPGFTPQVWNRISHCYSSNNQYAGDAADLNYYGLLDAVNPAATIVGSPYAFDTDPTWPCMPVLRVVYREGHTTNRHVATVLETPPANLRSNLGLHALPGCVWFQVEFLMPEDPRNGLDHPDGYQRNDMPRWTEVNADLSVGSTTYVFVPDTAANREAVARLYVPGTGATGRLLDFAQVVPPGLPYNGPDNVANRRVRMWPYAIRITVRVFDPRGRLDEPVVRSLVHRFE